jgi:hypothetical protein
VINANTKTATKVFMVLLVAVEYGEIGQIRRRKNGGFIAEIPRRVIGHPPFQNRPPWASKPEFNGIGGLRTYTHARAGMRHPSLLTSAPLPACAGADSLMGAFRQCHQDRLDTRNSPAL